MIVLSIVAILLCFIYLARIVDLYFVPSLDKISDNLKLSHDAAGATLMAIGSSAPELFVALFSVLRPGEHQSIAIGSIVGSAIFNLLVIVGAVALIKDTKLIWQPIVRDIGFYFVSVVLLVYFIWDGEITMIEVIIFLAIYVIYVIAVVFWRKILPYNHKDSEIEEDDSSQQKGFIKWIDKSIHIVFARLKYHYIVFFVSIIVIAALSWALVELAIHISHFFNIPEAIIALTVLAVGTSIPDLFSSIIVARQNRGEMAVSNAIGSNIFDILVGLGLPLLLFMLISKETVPAANESLISSSIILFGSVILLFLFLIIKRWKINKLVGYMLIGLYLFYIIREIILAI